MTITATRRGFLAGLLGTTVIAVLPSVPTVADAAPVLNPYEVTPVPGWTYQWVRCSLLGEPDPQNVQDRLDNGWAFVPPASHPEACAVDVEVAIDSGGLVLMRKATEEIGRAKTVKPIIPDGIFVDHRRGRNNLSRPS